MKKGLYLILVFAFFTTGLLSQSLKPGFSKQEYIELLKISARSAGDSSYSSKFPVPTAFTMQYRSDVMGLDNRWDLWTNSSNTEAVISIRGTTKKAESWLANFYAAMVPAKGQLRISEDDLFEYKLAENPRAAVHAGWLLCMAILSRDIVPRVDSIYRTGIKDVFIMGHSQGGAIAYLLTAHLRSLQQQKLLPSDMHFKTYCSAAPKPGNLYFAYEYEAATQEGWAFNVVNAVDWVPETPVSIQTIADFNKVNPFAGASRLIRKQKFPRNIVLKHIFNKLRKPSMKAISNYQKYLGKYAAKNVKKYVKGFEPPEYYPGNHYVRTGATIVLLPGRDYYQEFPDKNSDVFSHHHHGPYLYLARRLKE